MLANNILIRVAPLQPLEKVYSGCLTAILYYAVIWEYGIHMLAGIYLLKYLFVLCIGCLIVSPLSPSEGTHNVFKK